MILWYNSYGEIIMRNELPKRKKLRLQGYDYSSEGCYFITILVKDKKPILSTIVRDDALIVPKKVVLKPCGEVVNKYINNINMVYNDITVENYIIMPNHIHMLISIDRFNSGTMRASSLTKIETVIRSLKKMVTRELGFSIWHRSYHDEIIRNEKQFQNAWNYIEYNALKEYGTKEENL